MLAANAMIGSILIGGSMLKHGHFWWGFIAGAVFLELLNVFNPGNIMSTINGIFGNLNPSSS